MRRTPALVLCVGIVLTACGRPHVATTPATPTPTLPAAPTATVTPPTSAAARLPTTVTSPIPGRPALPMPIAPPPEDGTRDPELVLGRIEIPAIGLDSELQEGIRLATLDDGPGHWPGSAMPGDLGNVVVAGHRTSHGAEFRHLDQLVAGNEVVLTTPIGRYTYVVESIEIVPPEALYIVTQTYERSATLFACHPPGSVAERIVAHLRLATTVPAAPGQ